MEVVLLWLDDLDDLLFTLALLWERLRRAILQVGLAAAFSLAASERLAIREDLTALLAQVAAASVALWCLGALLRAYYLGTRRAAA